MCSQQSYVYTPNDVCYVWFHFYVFKLDWRNIISHIAYDVRQDILPDFSRYRVQFRPKIVIFIVVKT